MKIRDCFDVNPTKNTNKYDDYINYIDTSSVVGGRLLNVTYLEKEYPSRAQRLVKKGDILYSSVRPNLKHFYYYCDNIEHAVASTGFVLLREKKNNEQNAKFVYYFLSTQQIIDYLSGIAELSQATFPSFSSKDIEKIDIPDISREYQDKIVNVISKYDEAIENNNKRISNLEQIGENLYKEWFVRFRFPNHEKAVFVNGLPKWKICKVSEVASIKAGGDKPAIYSDKPSDECCIPIYSNGIDNDGLYGYTDKAVVKKDSITISARGTVGFVCLHRHQFVPIVRLLAITPNHDDLLYYLYYSLKYDGVIGNGTSQQQITVPMVNRKRIMIPDEEIVSKFAQFNRDIWDAIDVLNKQNDNLNKQRDLLLPRLMSGKLEI